MTTNPYELLRIQDIQSGSEAYPKLVPQYGAVSERGNSFLKRDLKTLGALLSPVSLSAYETIADQLFGAESRHRGLEVEHGLNLLAERKLLHERHLEDIAHRDWQLQEQLFGAQLHAHVDDHRRELRVRQMILQLDEIRRKEERDFWKDTMEIRKELFEAGKEYGGLRARSHLFKDIEAAGASHG